MILEDQYGVGDVIDTGEAIGTVENVSLRVTRLRDASGVVWYVRNGEIVRIGNKSQGWSTAVVDIPVSYDENLERVIPLIQDVVRAFDATPEWKEHAHRGAAGGRRRVDDRHRGDGADHRQNRSRAAVRRLRGSCASGSRPPSTRRASRARRSPPSPQRPAEPTEAGGHAGAADPAFGSRATL